MKKIFVASAVHCPASVACLTVGSISRSLPSDCEASFHIGVHENFDDYTHERSLFKDLEGIANFYFVDEIDWDKYHDVIHRYSVMHAKNICNILSSAKYFEWDYLLITDQDVFYNHIPIHQIIDNNVDFYTGVFDNKDKPWSSTTIRNKIEMAVMPKPTAHHMILSREAFELCTEDNVYPEVITGDENNWYYDMYNQVAPDLPVFYDTFSKMYHNIRYRTRLNVQIGGFDGAVHYGKCSFNYGRWTVADKYDEYIKIIEGIYQNHFPDGLEYLKVKR